MDIFVRVLAYLDNAGFPSDHVLFTTAITLAVWFETRQRKVVIILAVLTALVALGRVIALVHTPLDVTGGFFFACIGALWYFTKPHTNARQIKKKTHFFHV